MGERMRNGRAICETVHVAALGVWLGALGMAGATAGVLFPTMKGLDPSLPAYAAYTAPHWRIAAGAPMARVFFITDVVQFVCALTAFVTFGLSVLVFGLSLRRPGALVRSAALLVLACSLSYSLFVLAPRMNGQLQRFWAAAEAGEMDRAEASRTAFDMDHPRASLLLSINAGAALVGLIGAGATMRGTGDADRPAAPAREEPTLGLEEPRLVREKR